MKKIVAIFSVLLVIGFYIAFRYYTKEFTIDSNSYLLPMNQVSSNLNNSDTQEKEAQITAIKVDDYSTVYKKGAKYYIGEKQKTIVDINYPAISLDGKRILNLNNGNELIDLNFESTTLYRNAILVAGELYNQHDNIRVDEEIYLFIKLQDNLFMNSFPLTIETTKQTYRIPENSIILFDDNEIRYYTLENGNYLYYKITGIDNNDLINYQKEGNSYYQFLIDLGLKKVEKAVENNKEEENNPNEEVPDDSTSENNNSSNNPMEYIYVKPTVELSNLASSVYSVNFNLKLNDSAKRIQKYPTFEILVNNQVYLRKTIYSGGKIDISGLLPNTSFKIVGYYTYYNEDNSLIKNNFYEGEFTTRNISELENIVFSSENVVVTSNNATIKSLAITNDKNAEVLKGIKKIVAVIDGNEYNVSSMILATLKKLTKIDYETPSTLNSSTPYNLVLKVYDVSDNELVVENNRFSFTTSKKEPTAKVTVLKTDITNFTTKVTIDNPDQVEIANLRYVATDLKGQLVAEGAITGSSILVENLAPNAIYKLMIYGDYDLEDGSGNRLNTLLSEVKISTNPISILGYLRVKLSNANITQNEANFKFNIDINNTNANLIELLNDITIDVYDKETGNFIKSIHINDTELLKLKNGDPMSLTIDSLYSNTEYILKYSSTIKQADSVFTITVISEVTEFITMKKEAQVNIINKFVNADMIDFDVQISDVDQAILSDRVLLEVRNNVGTLISMTELKVNDEYQRLTFSCLNKGENYTFNYIVEEYNLGHNNITWEENKVLFKDTILTETGIYGNIELESLLKQSTGKNLFDINNTQRWKSTAGASTLTQIDYNYEENVVFLYASNGYRNYSYYLPELAGKVVTVSFYAKYDSTTTYLPVYLSNSDGSSKSYQLTNINNEWTKYTFTFTLNSKGYVGFYVDEQANNNTITKLGIKDLQIEVGSSATTYEPYQEKENFLATVKINLADNNNEITNNDYYVRIYKNDELVDTIKYDLPSNKIVTDFLASYDVEKYFNYTIKLAVKIRDRFYDVNALEFSTEEEIRTISNVTEFYNIHTNGKYIVIEDLDFTAVTSILATPFSGTIDFQGHKILLDVLGAPSSLMKEITSSGTLTNLDAHFYFNNTSARGSFYGLVEYNYGTISNIKITLEEATPYYNDVTSFITYCNRGTIENFVIHAKASLYTKRWATFGALHNYGTMKNGYAYGEAINADATTSYSLEAKRVGIIAGYTAENSLIENVYSLIDINVLAENDPTAVANDRLVGNLVGQNARGVINNAYSYASGKNRNTEIDPNIGLAGVISTKNIYYVNDEMYADKYSLKISKLALRDIGFQNQLLNRDNKFNVSDYVKYGFYPQIIWPESMPNQEYIELPTVKDSDLIDIISVEKIEQNGDKATVQLSVNNPGSETITNLQIKDLTTTILSQETVKGKTILTVEVSNPIKYISKYYVKSITSEGIFGISYTREYANAEKVLEIDLYKRVSTVADWKNIKTSLSENYILVNDIDFTNQPVANIQLGNLTGKINGNGHTIKNIEITSGNAVINVLTGTVENLFIENYKKSSKEGYGGFINQASTNSMISNVHLKDVKVIATTYIGGLVGHASDALIKDSSVTNLTLYDLTGLIDVRVGGLVGHITNTQIYNCYAQNVNLDVRNATLIYAVGGLVGNADSGTIEHAYTTGVIYTNSSNSGGLIGRNNGSVEKVYTNIDIFSQADYVGGIIGQTINENISSTLSVGSIYSSASVNNLGRTIGNKNLNQSNYAWDKQLLNGIVSSQVNGEILLSTNLLNQALTYQQQIKLGSMFDYSNLGNNGLPLLKNSLGEKLLPNQEQNHLKSTSFEIKDIIVDKQVDRATVRFTIDNPNNYEIKNIQIEYLNITRIAKNITENGITTYEIEVSPDKYYDSYRIHKLIYLVNGQEVEYAHEVKIPLQFYKDIEKYEDWQKISQNTSENYRLIADIDFNGKTNVNYNVSFNRLEGTDGGHTLKNINLTGNGINQSLISSIQNKISNIKFENITMTNTGSGNNYGIISFTFGYISDLTFENITIKASNMNYVGMIGTDRSTDIRNISLKGINVIGKGYVGGLIGITGFYGINNITLEDVTVEGKGNYVGGMIAYATRTDVQPLHFNVTADNVTVTNTANYTGGIYGYGTAQYVTINNSNITGVSYVGGISGQAGNRYTNNHYIDNMTITASGSYIAGDAGHSDDIKYSYVTNSTITATSTSSQYVGGIGGTGGWTIHYSSVNDTIITSLGKYVGGIRGYLSYSSINRCSTANVTITGNSYVGGLSGGHTGLSSTIQHSTTNAVVTATVTGAGGVLGYSANINTDAASNRMYIYRNIVQESTITAPTESGGLIGKVDTTIYPGHSYSNIVSATVATTNASSTPGIVIGSSDSYATGISNMKVYDGSKLIKDGTTQIVSNMTINGITSANLLTLTQLKTQSTYTNLGMSTSILNFSQLANGYYPYLVDIQSPYVEYISFPTNTKTLASTMSLSARSVLSSLDGYHEMPSYQVYASDIDKINIEFSKTDEYTTIMVNGKEYNINQRVLTFNYNFKDDIVILMTDGLNTKEEVIKAGNLVIKTSTYQDRYYIIGDEEFITNDEKALSLIESNGMVRHLYKNYILYENNYIYNIETSSLLGFSKDEKNISNDLKAISLVDNNELVSQLSKDYVAYENNYVNNIDSKILLEANEILFKNLTQIKPLYEFVYEGTVIKTFNNYSTIDDINIIEKQILVKNAQIEMVSSSLNNYKNSIIMNNYNGNDYLTILATDGIIYDLKSEITKPNKFSNKKINTMSSNIDSQSSLVVIIYESGEILCFNYQTGEIIYQKKQTDINIIDYYLDNIIPVRTNTLLMNIAAVYEESNNLQTKLENNPINKVLEDNKTTTTKPNYIQVYDPIKNKYEIYDMNKVVEKQSNNLTQQVQSVTDVIFSNNILKEYYLQQSATGITQQVMDYLYIFIGIMGILIAAIIYLIRLLRKRNPEKMKS